MAEEVCGARISGTSRNAAPWNVNRQGVNRFFRIDPNLPITIPGEVRGHKPRAPAAGGLAALVPAWRAAPQTALTYHWPKVLSSYPRSPAGGEG